jgi:hypothetical protein
MAVAAFAAKLRGGTKKTGEVVTGFFSFGSLAFRRRFSLGFS